MNLQEAVTWLAESLGYETKYAPMYRKSPDDWAIFNWEWRPYTLDPDEAWKVTEWLSMGGYWVTLDAFLKVDYGVNISWHDEKEGAPMITSVKQIKRTLNEALGSALIALAMSDKMNEASDQAGSKTQSEDVFPNESP